MLDHHPDISRYIQIWFATSQTEKPWVFDRGLQVSTNWVPAVFVSGAWAIPKIRNSNLHICGMNVNVNLHERMYVCTRWRMHAWNAWTYVRMDECTHVCICGCMHVCMSQCIDFRSTCITVYIYIYTYTYQHIHVYTSIHIYTHRICARGWGDRPTLKRGSWTNNNYNVQHILCSGYFLGIEPTKRSFLKQERDWSIGAKHSG